MSINKTTILSTIAGFASAIMCVLATGCSTLPTADQMTSLGKASGYTAAYVLNTHVTLDTTARDAICNIVGGVEKIVPETNSTYAATWTPVAKKYLDGFKDKSGNALPDATKDLVLTNFNYLVGLIDKYVDKKGVRQYTDLTDAFIHSFCDTFLANFKKSETVSAGVKKQDLDEFTYATMMEAIKK